MSACRRFEEEALPRLEEGLALDEHFSTCADCRAARAARDRLVTALGALGLQSEPRPGWEARVRDAIARRGRGPRRRWPVWPAAVAGVAAAVAVVLLVGRPPGAGPSGELTIELQRGQGPTRRSTDGQPGDRLVVQATTKGARYAQVRIYRNDRELLFQCASEHGRDGNAGRLIADVRLDTAGRYQVLLLLSARPLPASSGSLDRDAGAALRLGAYTRLGPDVQVK